jgi:hypothetical protein
LPLTHTAGGPMSKKQRLVEYSFRPAQILAMRDAFQKACKAPQVADGAPNVTEGVARRILELAKAGETSPDRLYAGALRKSRLRTAGGDKYGHFSTTGPDHHD